MLLEPAPPNEYPVLRPALALRAAWRRVTAWAFVTSHWLRGHSVRRLVRGEHGTCWTCGLSRDVRESGWNPEMAPHAIERELDWLARVRSPPRAPDLDDDRPSLPEP